MTFTDILFYIFSVVLLISAIKVVTAKNPMHAVLFLVLTFATSACLWLLMQAEFLAIILILVYVGAVMVFFIFVVMMLNIDVERMRAGFWKNLPLGLLVGGIASAEVILVLLSGKIQKVLNVDLLEEAPETANNARELGMVLYTDYLLPFELASVLLTLGMVAAIALAHRKHRQAKYVNPTDQVKVKPGENRMRMVKMACEVDEPIKEVSEEQTQETPKEGEGKQ